MQGQLRGNEEVEDLVGSRAKWKGNGELAEINRSNSHWKWRRRVPSAGDLDELIGGGKTKKLHRKGGFIVISEEGSPSSNWQLIPENY
jgi:hypothetical protein